MEGGQNKSVGMIYPLRVLLDDEVEYEKSLTSGVTGKLSYFRSFSQENITF